jgi:hypothetical protein
VLVLAHCAAECHGHRDALSIIVTLAAVVIECRVSRWTYVKYYQGASRVGAVGRYACGPQVRRLMESDYAFSRGLIERTGT